MLSVPLLILVSASGALARTPQGFAPAVENSLVVSFGSAAAMDGNVLAKASTQTAPTIGTQSKLDGTSFAVVMVDLDIPTDSPPQTNTLLHWMQTGLTQSTSATALNTTAGSMDVFTLQTSQQTAFAAYIGPSPPARTPLSHRYTQLLIDTSSATAEDLSVLQSAAATRMGFNANTVLTQAGLVDKVIAANFFNVTNPGPVGAATNTNSTGSGSSRGTGSVTSPTQNSTPLPGAAASQKASELLVAIVMVGAAFFAL
ncbi:phosphatidylethanolamine-binding protein [Biscogniauxia mediterranea]|nr:phosphatidylethanolamine-binding protein [Biscogniauxia mediterranea]